MTKEEQIALDQWREDEAIRASLADRSGDGVTRMHIKHNEYRRLVRDDVRPPVVVDRAGECLAKVTLQLAKSDEDKATYIICTYGDERHAEGERAGIERVLAWYQQTWPNRSVDYMRQALLGELQ